jgi:hypothetical protein
MRDLRLAEPAMLIGTSIPAKKARASLLEKLEITNSKVLLPANCRSIGCDRSAPRWVAPPGSDVLTIFDKARNDRISSRVLKHFSLSVLVILGIVFDEINILFVVVILRPLTVRAPWLGINY